MPTSGTWKLPFKGKFSAYDAASACRVVPPFSVQSLQKNTVVYDPPRCFSTKDRLAHRTQQHPKPVMFEPSLQPLTSLNDDDDNNTPNNSQPYQQIAVRYKKSQSKPKIQDPTAFRRWVQITSSRRACLVCLIWVAGKAWSTRGIVNSEGQILKYYLIKEWYKIAKIYKL